MQLNGAEIVIGCLKEQGVDTVFGYPGGAILNVYGMQEQPAGWECVWLPAARGQRIW